MEQCNIFPCLHRIYNQIENNIHSLTIYLGSLCRYPNENYVLQKLSNKYKYSWFCFYFLEVYIVSTLSYHNTVSQVRKPRELECGIWKPQGHAHCGLVE